MQLDYAIEEMLLQSPTLVVYKARGRNGFRYAISRFVYTKSILSNLKEACFDSALQELKRLTHGCLRPVIDGGLDEVDGMPWVARVWWDGEYLDDRMRKGVLTPPDIQRLVDHGEALVDALGDRASAVSFRARDVILTSGRGGQPVETFNVDVKNWFRNWAMGMPPGGGVNARSELRKLVVEAEQSAMGYMEMQEDEAQQSHQQLSVPQPPPTQVLVAPPPVTQSLVPSQAPTGPVLQVRRAVPAPVLSGSSMQAQSGVPAPPPTGPLLQVQRRVPSPQPTGPLVQAQQGGVPAPPPTGQLMQGQQAGVPAPPPTGQLMQGQQAGVPAPQPTGPLIPMPMANQQAPAAPTPSQMLVQSPPANQIPYPNQAPVEGQAPAAANKLLFERPGQARRLHFR